MIEPKLVSPYELSLDNPYGIPVRILANEQVAIDRSGIEKLLALLDVVRTIDEIQGVDERSFGDSRAKKIGPVIETQVQAGMVRKVAELRPILMVTG